MPKITCQKYVSVYEFLLLLICSVLKNYPQHNKRREKIIYLYSHLIFLYIFSQVTIPLQSFTNKTKCITNINNCHEDHGRNDEEEEVVKANEERMKSSQTQITPGSSNDSILKSIDEDNKSTSSSVSTSSAFEDSTNLYSEKSESSMSSINMLNKINENGSIAIKICEKSNHVDDDDALEVLSAYDNDSGNDEFDEKGDGFNNFSYSSSDSRCDRKFKNHFNSLPLIRTKKPTTMTTIPNNFNSIKRKHYIDGSMEQEPFHDDSKVINLPSPSPSSWSSDSNMIQQQNLSTKSSSVPMLVRRDQYLEDFNKLTVSYRSIQHQQKILILSSCVLFPSSGITEFAVTKRSLSLW